MSKDNMNISENSNRSKELEPAPLKIALAACMDDALKFGEGILWVGLGGSLVTADQPTDSFGQDSIDLVKRTRQKVYQAIIDMAAELKVSLGITSHDGCGWCAAQSIIGEEVSAATDQMTEELKNGDLAVEFAGNIGYSEAPSALAGSNDITACITRSPAEHSHSADGIILTTGGFITQEEVEAILAEKNWRKAFIISADWKGKAISDFQLSEKDADALIHLQINLANKIMDKELPQYSFNAGRL